MSLPKTDEGIIAKLLCIVDGHYKFWIISISKDNITQQWLALSSYGKIGVSIDNCAKSILCKSSSLSVIKTFVNKKISEKSAKGYVPYDNISIPTKTKEFFLRTLLSR
jgi:predicted DNA-binding WGR domain protein